MRGVRIRENTVEKKGSAIKGKKDHDDRKRGKGGYRDGKVCFSTAQSARRRKG